MSDERHDPSRALPHCSISASALSAQRCDEVSSPKDAHRELTPEITDPTSLRRTFFKLATVGGLAAAALLKLSPKAHAQPLTAAMWIHGTSVQVEFPERVLSIARRGFSTTIVVEGRPNWFHFFIPTPVILSGDRLRLESVILRYRLPFSQAVTNVHIYDAERLLIGYNGLDRRGDQFFDRYAVPDLPEVRFGIGVSVNYDNNAIAADPFIEFFAAGADFIS
jgi:hypothetical protein